MKLTELKGIGAKTEELFAKIGVESVEDLLEFFPRDYEFFNAPTTIAEIGYKTFATIRGMFLQSAFTRKTGRVELTTATFKDEIGGSIKVAWFNAPYMAKTLNPGELYILRGRVSRKYGVLQMDQPKVFTPAEYMKVMNGMQPVYNLTKGLTNSLIAKAVSQAFDTPAYFAACAADPVPESIAAREGLCPRSEAIKNLHFPKNEEAFRAAATHMSFEEIFLFIMTMKRNNSHLKEKSSCVIQPSDKTRGFLDALPFTLTAAQKRVIDDINQDMAGGFVMNRLIQGDVGSGKTIVALAALMNAAFAGYQGALMAPTEVLAEQHFKTISKLLEEHGTGLNAALLTGSMDNLQKKVVYDALEDGRIDIIIGTHALFQEKTRYKSLGLIVTDEQHRFGVKQREALAGKGNMPHMMVMSATPIPRTLALIIYGDMDVSTIDVLPTGRKPIKNAVVDDSYKENAYRFIEKEVAKGHQAYIICPLVEYTDGLDAQNVEDYTQMLRETLDESISIGMLHGQMPAAKKNEIMSRFAEGKIQVLVATTVIEVGVDVPNATVMMIEDANRFGLAALHQLRGRVGRGADQSYCIFVSNSKSEQAMERLNLLGSSNNGFEIAQMDLKMRGPGEFMGTRQSGALSFKNFDIYRDADIATRAAEAADEIINGKVRLTEEEQARLESRISLTSRGILL